MQKAKLKKQVDSLVNELPEDTTWEELIWKIYVRQSIEEGFKDSKEGNITPHEKIEKKYQPTPWKLVGEGKRSGNSLKYLNTLLLIQKLYAYRLVNKLEFKCHKLKVSETAILK